MNDTLTTDVRDHLDFLREVRRYSDNTCQTYSVALRQFTAFANAGGVANYLSPRAGELARFLEKLTADGLAPASVSLKVTAVRQFFRWLVSSGKMSAEAVRPIELLRLATGWKRLPGALSVAEVHRLLAAPQAVGETMHLRNLAILETLYATGCRASELIGMELANLDLAAASVRVIGKGRRERVVLLSDTAVEALKVYLDEVRPVFVRRRPDSAFVFVKRGGEPIQHSRLFHLVRASAAVAGLPRWVGCHTLRHSCAVHLLQGGADIRYIGELLGHRNVETTTRYLRLDASHLHSVHERCHPRGGSAARAGDGELETE